MVETEPGPKIDCFFGTLSNLFIVLPFMFQWNHLQPSTITNPRNTNQRGCVMVLLAVSYWWMKHVLFT